MMFLFQTKYKVKSEFLFVQQKAMEYKYDRPKKPFITSFSCIFEIFHISKGLFFNNPYR